MMLMTKGKNFLNLLLIHGSKIDKGVNIKKLPIMLYKPTFNPNGEFNICLTPLKGIKLYPRYIIPLSIKILSLKLANVKPIIASK